MRTGYHKFGFWVCTFMLLASWAIYGAYYATLDEKPTVLRVIDCAEESLRYKEMPEGCASDCQVVKEIRRNRTLHVSPLFPCNRVFDQWAASFVAAIISADLLMLCFYFLNRGYLEATRKERWRMRREMEAAYEEIIINTPIDINSLYDE